jgi:vacuolar-type H+-ATPase subunit I/STV1
MAIAKTKKMTLAVMINDRARLMRRLQRLGCVDIIKSANCERLISPAEAARRNELAAWIARFDVIIQKFAPYDPIKRGVFPQKPVADEATMAGALAWRGQARQIADRAEEIWPLIAGTFTRKAKEKNLIDALKPWSGLTAPLERIGETQNTVSGLLIIPERRYDAFVNAIRALDIPAVFNEINRTGGKTYILIATHKLEAAAMDSLIKEFGAIRAQFNGLYDRAQVNINYAEARLKRVINERADLDREIAQLGKEIHALRTLRDVEAAELDRLNAMARGRATRSAFIINAWVLVDCITAIEQAVKDTVSVYVLEFNDPGASDKPPALLKNTRSSRPFKPLRFNTRYVEIINH